MLFCRYLHWVCCKHVGYKKIVNESFRNNFNVVLIMHNIGYYPRIMYIIMEFIKWKLHWPCLGRWIQNYLSCVVNVYLHSVSQFHVLVIIVDGKATMEKETCSAIVTASKCPLSIVLVGVGDGPWQSMESFHKQLPHRQFDNFRFVDFNRVITYGAQAETTFAVHALLDVLDQYNAVRGLGLLNHQLMW